MAIVTISKEYAAESDVFADHLARRLGYDVFDKQVVEVIARVMKAPRPEVPLFPRITISRFLQLIDQPTASAIQEILGKRYGMPDSTYYFNLIRQLVEKVAQQNNVIIVGWGGQCILAHHPSAIHVRIVKNIEERIAILKQQFDLDDKGARELIEQEERESARYIEYYFNRLWDDPHLYHLVVNLSKITFEQAVDIVESLVRYGE